MERIDYNGERTSKALIDFAVRHMPSFVLKASKGGLDKALRASPLPKAVLFTDKKAVPPIAMALSTKVHAVSGEQIERIELSQLQ